MYEVTDEPTSYVWAPLVSIGGFIVSGCVCLMTGAANGAKALHISMCVAAIVGLVTLAVIWADRNSD